MKLSSRKRRKTYNNGRYAGIILLGILFFLLNVPKIGFAQEGGISIGQTVEITSGQGLRLHTEPGLNTPVIVTLIYKTQMKVVGGPRNADNYIWWEIEGTPGRGWAAENYLKVVDDVSSPGSTPLVEGANCKQLYPAINYCTSNQSDYVVLIDVNNPHVRLETIMANNKPSVNTSNRQYVSAMGEKRREEGAVVVINADYFGDTPPVHGPEGFTVVKGQRLDGPLHGDFDGGVATLRSALVFSKSKLDGGDSPIVVSLLRLDNDKFVPNPSEIYYAAGGGPQIVFNGAWDWTRGRNKPKYKDYPECPLDYLDNDVINGECFRKTSDWDSADKVWTVVGKKKDGRLVMLIAPYSQVKSTLETYQVLEAIKLDGGGSSQLWLNNQSVLEGGRPVANGLMVFYKNDYAVEEQPQWPVVVSGENLTIEIILKNTGADTWTQKDYVIVSTKNPWDMSLRIKLPQDVKAGESVTLKWQSDPIDKTWGIYSLDFQVTDHGNEFPTTPIDIQMIVIPQDLAEKKQELEQKIRDWIDKGVEDIEREITTWIEQQLQGLLQWIWNQIITWLYENCYLPITTLIIAALLLRRRYNYP